MRLSLAARLARRDLRGGLRGLWVFLLCLALGVVAIATVQTLRDATLGGLAAEGRSILGGDVAIGLSYRFASSSERQWLARQGQVSEVVEFRSLAVAGDERALTQVKGVDAAWPLVGAVQLDPPQPVAQALASRDGVPSAVMEPLLAARLGLRPGDRFRLGDRTFILAALLVNEPDNGGGGLLLGPKTVVRTADLAGSGMLAPGSMYQSEYRLLLPPATDPDALHQAAAAVFAGGALRWSDARHGAPGTERFLAQLSNFLLLAGLAALIVGGVGIAAAVRGHLAARRADIATLKVLGAGRRLVLAAYGLQVAALAAVGIAAGVVLGALLPALLLPSLATRLQLPVASALQPAALAEAALYGALAAAMFTLTPLAAAADVRPAALWREAALPALTPPRWRVAASLLAVPFVAVAAFLTRAPILVLATTGALLAAALLLAATAALMRRMARVLARRVAPGRGSLQLALASIGGPAGEARTTVLALGIGLTVLSAIAQIGANLHEALAQQLPARAPAFFVLDIQPQEIEPFLAFAHDDPDVTAVQTAPMLRGVITRINGRPAADVAPDSWVLRGDRGVTYAASPPAGTRLVAGSWWAADYTGPPLISFSAREAAELGLHLGDRLTVNILGRDIEGTIASFREVDFSSAGLGFVLVFDPHALAGAPSTSIATLYGPAAADARLLRTMSDRWPNLTPIAVRDVIGRAGELLAAIIGAVRLAALGSLAAGIVVLFGLAAATEQARRREAALLKVLGATRGRVLWSFALRSAIPGGTAALVAVGIGAAAAWAVCTFLLEAPWRLALAPAVATVAGGVAATLLAGLTFALRPLAASAASVLRARE